MVRGCWFCIAGAFAFFGLVLFVVDILDTWWACGHLRRRYVEAFSYFLLACCKYLLHICYSFTSRLCVYLDGETQLEFDN
jgi:hypothetical protein